MVAVMTIASFPFLETLLLGTQLNLLRKGEKPYATVIWGLLIGAALLVVINVRDIGILGVFGHSSTVFPGYKSVSIIELGTFFTRFEAVVSSSLILCSYTKLGICLLACSKGMAYMFKIKDYRDVVVPLAMTMIGLAMLMYSNFIQMLLFASLYHYIALPLQTLVPLTIWIVAEVKAKKANQLAQLEAEF